MQLSLILKDNFTAHFLKEEKREKVLQQGKICFFFLNYKPEVLQKEHKWQCICNAQHFHDTHCSVLNLNRLLDIIPKNGGPVSWLKDHTVLISTIRIFQPVTKIPLRKTKDHQQIKHRKTSKMLSIWQVEVCLRIACTIGVLSFYHTYQISFWSEIT